MAKIEKMLVCVDSKDTKAGGTGKDHNKFYRASYANGTIYYEYGRIGQTSTKGQKGGSEADYEKLIRSKMKKGYVEVDVHQSEDLSVTANKDERVVKAIAADPQVEAVVKQLVAVNKHDLFEGKFDLTIDVDGAIRTHIGVLTSKTINKARTLLNRILKGEMDLIKEYFILIPHVVPIGTPLTQIVSDWEDEKRVFNQLAQSVTDYEENKDKQAKVEIADDEFASLFSVKLTPASADEINQIKAFFDKTKNDQHYGASRMKVVDALVINYSDEEVAKYENVHAKLGNVQQLWHGTTAQNVLNILRKGLFCPKETDRTYGITGRMFGNGVYLSDQSTKSLNYSRGGWGQQNNSDISFMFLTDTAMGREFKPKEGTHRMGDIPRLARDGGYDSITVEAGNYVRNNEMIVWDTDQIRLRYLVMFK